MYNFHITASLAQTKHARHDRHDLVMQAWDAILGAAGQGMASNDGDIRIRLGDGPDEQAYDEFDWITHNAKQLLEFGGATMIEDGITALDGLVQYGDVWHLRGKHMKGTPDAIATSYMKAMMALAELKKNLEATREPSSRSSSSAHASSYTSLGPVERDAYQDNAYACSVCGRFIEVYWNGQDAICTECVVDLD